MTEEIEVQGPEQGPGPVEAPAQYTFQPNLSVTVMQLAVIVAMTGVTINENTFNSLAPDMKALFVKK